MNEKNLKKFQSVSEARESGRKGGIASGVARRKKRELRFALLALMENEKNGKNGIERMAAALFRKALDGDIKAIQLIDDYVSNARITASLPEIEWESE